MSKFKIGDQVKVVDAREYLFTSEGAQEISRGEEGYCVLIREVSGDNYSIAPMPGESNGKRKVAWWREDQLVLVYRPEYNLEIETRCAKCNRKPDPNAWYSECAHCGSEEFVLTIK